MTLSTYPISNGLPAFNLGPSFLEYAIQREMKMASIKENLIAAKALIDTPEKWNTKRSAQAACAEVTGIIDGGPEFIALRCASYGGNRLLHAELMDCFDRAIAAQDGA